MTLRQQGSPKLLRSIEKGMPMPPLVLSSESHVFEPLDLWQTRIDRAFPIGYLTVYPHLRKRAPLKACSALISRPATVIDLFVRVIGKILCGGRAHEFLAGLCRRVVRTSSSHCAAQLREQRAAAGRQVAPAELEVGSRGVAYWREMWSARRALRCTSSLPPGSAS